MGNVFSSINVYWPQIRDQFPGFDKPMILPAATLRHEAGVHHATYMLDQIDQDKTAQYLFIKGNPRKGPCDRDTAVRLFKTLMMDKMGMPSSFMFQADMHTPSGLTPDEAADLEVLPRPADARQPLSDGKAYDDFQKYYDEQMDALEGGEEAKKKDDEAFRAKHGFDRDDPSIIDVDVVGTDDSGREVFGAAGDLKAARERAIAARSAQYAVAEPKPILYCVCVHSDLSHNALGYDRGSSRLRGGAAGQALGRGRSSGFLREKDAAVDEGALDLGTRENSMTAVIEANWQELMHTTSVQQLVDALKRIFQEAGIDTPASRRLLMNVSRNRDVVQAQITVANSKLAGNGLRTYGRRGMYEDEVGECDACGDPECVDGEKCGLSEEDLDDMVKEADEDEVDEADDPAEYFCKAEEDEEIVDGYDTIDEFEKEDDEEDEVRECDDVEDEPLNESFSVEQVRAWNRLTRIDQ